MKRHPFSLKTRQKSETNYLMLMKINLLITYYFTIYLKNRKSSLK